MKKNQQKEKKNSQIFLSCLDDVWPGDGPPSLSAGILSIAGSSAKFGYLGTPQAPGTQPSRTCVCLQSTIRTWLMENVARAQRTKKNTVVCVADKNYTWF